MASTHTPIRSLLSPLLSSFRSLTLSSTNSTSTILRTIPQNARAFSTTPPMAKRPDKKKLLDPRITLIRYHMQHPLTPRPLKLGRMRALRHWTIHRAWMLARRKKLDSEERELERMYQSTFRAMEALRNLDTPGTPGAGRLYRIALEKKGIFKPGGVPIEYARYQTDTPAKEAWNHAWTR